jgi:hypothetical protein
MRSRWSAQLVAVGQARGGRAGCVQVAEGSAVQGVRTAYEGVCAYQVAEEEGEERGARHPGPPEGRQGAATLGATCSAHAYLRRCRWC